MTDQADWTPSVAIVNTVPVTVTGTATVAVSGVVSVTFSGTQNVNVQNTPAVTISGTVTATISSGTVNIQTAGGVTVQAAGGLTYVGSLPWAGSGTFDLAVNLGPFDRSVVVMLNVTGEGLTGGLVIVVRPVGDAFRTVNTVVYNLGVPGLTGAGAVPFVAYVNPGVQTNWQLHLVSTDASAAGTAYVFTDQAMPERGLTNASAPLPVMLQSGDNGARIGTNNPLPVASVFQHSKPYDSPVLAAPGVNTQATITVAGAVGFRQVLDYAEWNVRTTVATSVAIGVRVLDGASTIFYSELSIPATVGAVDRLQIGPGLGYASASGNGLTVKFDGAAGANTVETLVAGVYAVPG